MSKLAWYWHRLRAMSPGEVALHVRKKLRQVLDARQHWDLSGVQLECSGSFPKLPRQVDAPEVLREALRRDVEDKLAGRWKAFGHLDLQVDDPPKWHKDYLAGRDLATDESAFRLDYRELPNGADIKLIWELSRWYPLVRLAMAAYVLGDGRAAAKCVDWLEDWVKHNPPYRGWNWTSALEVGMRLVQFTWMDALLSGRSRINGAQKPSTEANSTDRSLLTAAPTMEKRLERLRQQILPPHVWYAWRHKSFGSSANNHLIGELAGLILATVRWPALAQWGASLDELQRRWEREVLAQFAEDGGNKEQALNYHLFSWEFCWQARMALMGSERKISPEVDERLRRAVQFFVDVQVPSDPWDYGDSDSAFVTPLFADGTSVLAEWHEWFRHPAKEQALEYWMGSERRNSGFEVSDLKEGEWRRLEASGYAIRREGDWTLRWDLSPLGLGTVAAHGHLDALHLSLWRRGVAMVIDPGTGAYHANKQLRNWLSSRSAHNVSSNASLEWPCRLGPFLWSSSHKSVLVGQRKRLVDWEQYPRGSMLLSAGLILEGDPNSITCRHVEQLVKQDGWVVFDELNPSPKSNFSVRWQFAPATRVEDFGKRRFRVTRHGVSMEIQVSADWAEVFCVTEQSQVAEADPDAPLAGVVSPAFRKTVWAPYLKLVARPKGDMPCLFSTAFSED